MKIGIFFIIASSGGPIAEIAVPVCFVFIFIILALLILFVVVFIKSNTKKGSKGNQYHYTACIVVSTALCMFHLQILMIELMVAQTGEL